MLTFWQQLSLYCLHTYGQCRIGDAGDAVLVEASSDGGLTWSQLVRMSNVSNTSTWSRQMLDLASHAGTRLRIRFRLADNGDSNVADGWTIDDVEIREFDQTSSPPNSSGGCRAATATRYFCDGFEGGLDNWITSSKDWNTTTSSNAVSDTHSLTDSPGGNYLDSAIASATLAGTVDLTAATAPALVFWHKLQLDSYRVNASYSYDAANVDISTNGGMSWSTLSAFNYSANTTTWSRQLLDLTPYVGSRVTIQFRMWDNAASGHVADGWYVDDVEIRELAPTAPPPNSNGGGCGAPTTTRYFCDSFEAGVDNWSVSQAAGGKDWDVTTSTSAVTGTHSLTDSPSGNYLNGARSSATLVGNIDLTTSTAPVITFWHKLSLASGDATYVELSTDGGLTWTQLASFGSGNNTSTWAQQMYSLATYAGKRLTLRFRFSDDGNGTQADGWYIDDVEIRELN